MTETIDLAAPIAPAFSTPREQDCLLERIEGRLPQFLNGSTYYLNGPARFQRGGLRYQHWLDGDGMVSALRFERGRARFRSRFVRCTKWIDEEAAGRPLYRTFGTRFLGDRLKHGIGLESPANVSVYPIDGALLAFGEQGLPWELDPDTLETRGRFDFHRSINPISPFAAHPKIDATSGEFFNFGISYSQDRPSLNYYRFNRSLSLARRARISLDAPRSLHDFGLSRNFAAFYLSPYVLDIEKLTRHGCSLMEALDWRPELGSRLLVLSREEGEEVASIGLGRRFSLHVANCFEEGRFLVVDTTEFERPLYEQYQGVPELFRSVDRGRPARLVIDLERGELSQRRTVDYPNAPDFPSVDPRQAGEATRHCWMLGLSAAGVPGGKFFDQLACIDWEEGRPREVYQAPRGTYLGGEPAFVPNPALRGQGAVVCQLYRSNTRRSAFAVFDAFNLKAGPVAMLELDSPLHFGFHSSVTHSSEP